MAQALQIDALDQLSLDYKSKRFPTDWGKSGPSADEDARNIVDQMGSLFPSLVEKWDKRTGHAILKADPEHFSDIDQEAKAFNDILKLRADRATKLAERAERDQINLLRLE